MRTGRGVVLASLLVALATASPAPAVVDPHTAGAQVALRARGHYGGPVDGIAGPLTKRAVRTFQRQAGLHADGVLGPRTRSELGRLGRPAYGDRTIRRGMIGWDVSILQFELRRRGAGVGRVDGSFGPQTQGAVQRFQQRAGIAVDGLVGPQTRSALARTRAAGAAPAAPALSRAEVRSRLIRISRQYGVSQKLVRSLAWVESGFQPQVVSAAGAQGVMQVVPATWRFVEHVLVGRRVPRTVNGNIRVGVLYLRHLLRLFGGDRRRAVAAYYQGPRAVQRHGLYPETRVYVRAVLDLSRRL